jgi:hypothetical protein
MIAKRTHLFFPRDAFRCNELLEWRHGPELIGL